MENNKFVTKEEFEKLKEKFNKLCEALTDLELKQPVSFDSLQVEVYDDEPEGENSPTDPDTDW